MRTQPTRESKTRRPAATPEGRESQLVSLAIDLAERQLADGTASSQVITHYLKLGSSREQLEQQRLFRENELLSAKVQQIEAGGVREELYLEAIRVMSIYKGDEEVYDEG